MTYKEMLDIANSYIDGDMDEYYAVIGIRFADLDQGEGEHIENSRHNPDRDDARSFPTYGTPEYNQLPELDGASAWDCKKNLKSDFDYCRSIGMHCYLVGGDKGQHDDPDDGEILARNAIILKKAY